MSFKTMALSPAGADLKVIFGPGVPDALREQIVQTWGESIPRASSIVCMMPLEATPVCGARDCAHGWERESV